MGRPLGSRNVATAADGSAMRTFAMIAQVWRLRSGQSISSQRVKQIHDRALRKLREGLERMGVEPPVVSD